MKWKDNGGGDFEKVPTGTHVARCIALIAQTARGQSNLPAIAAVVGFKALEVVISPLGAEE